VSPRSLDAVRGRALRPAVLGCPPPSAAFLDLRLTAAIGRALLAASFALGLALIPVLAGAQTPPPIRSDTAAAAAPGGSLAAAVAPAASPEARVAEVRANFTPENRSYSSKRQLLGFLDPLYGIALGLLILFTGLSARMRDVAHRAGTRRYPRVLVYIVLYTLVAFVLGFPLAWYEGFALEHQFGLSNQGFGAWIGDELKGAAVGIFFFGVIPLVALAYGAIRKSPRRWWLWLGVGTVPVIVIASLIQPLVIDPLFNKFTPLRDQQLKQEILDLAGRAGIPGRNVYEVDKSAQTKKYNAYVNGFGASQRIVLWDTTLKGMTDDEILFVMGHEMGHYVLGHVWQGIIVFSLLGFVVFFGSWVLMNWAVKRFGGRWGFTELHDVASMPLLTITLSLASLVVQPAANSFSRHIEHDSDIFGLEVTRLNDAGARAFIKLGSQNKSDPEPSALVEFFQYTHPPLIERVRFATEYHPWTEGKPSKLFHGRVAAAQP